MITKIISELQKLLFFFLIFFQVLSANFVTVLFDDFDEKSSVPSSLFTERNNAAKKGSWTAVIQNDSPDQEHVIIQNKISRIGNALKLHYIRENSKTIKAANASLTAKTEIANPAAAVPGSMAVVRADFFRNDESQVSLALRLNGIGQNNIPVVYITGSTYLGWDTASKKYVNSGVKAGKNGWSRIEIVMKWNSNRNEKDNFTGVYDVFLERTAENSEGPMPRTLILSNLTVYPDVKETYDQRIDLMAHSGGIPTHTSITYWDNISLEISNVAEKSGAGVINEIKKTQVTQAPSSPQKGDMYTDSVHEKFLFANTQKLSELFAQWQKEKPKFVKYEVFGKSWLSRPPIQPNTPTTDILALHVTDMSIPDTDKQVVIIAALRIVFSLTPANVLFTARWLLSDDPLAIETRKKQHIIFIPSPRPYYHTTGGMVPESLYDHWSFSGVTNPETNIESAAIQKLLDTWKPDVFIDISGRVGHREAMTVESAGLGGRSALASCYWPEIPVKMADAAAAGGYQVHQYQAYFGHGIIPSPTPMPDAPQYYYLQSSKVLPTDYAYKNFHTIGIPVIISFRESLLLMMKELFRIGNNVWKGEKNTGYPVKVVGGSGPFMLAAWGADETQKRNSRVALWQNKHRIGVSYVNDPHPNANAAILITDPSCIDCLFKAGPRSAAGASVIGMYDLFDNIEKSNEADRFNLNPVRSLLARHWRGSRYLSPPYQMQKTAKLESYTGGINIRCQFPFVKAKILEVLLDGHPLRESITDGYTVIDYPGTVIEIAIPPGKVKAFHVIGVEVETNRPFDEQDEEIFRSPL